MTAKKPPTKLLTKYLIESPFEQETKSPFEPATKTTSAAPRPVGMRYPTPLMNSIVNGAVIDQRVALAMQLAISAVQGHGFDAVNLLDQADALYAEAEARGWVQPLPVDDFLPQAEVAHIRRQVKAQLEGQSTAQAFAAAAQAQLNPTRRTQ